ncbi:ATP synthase F1 subunit delta [Dehalococcoidia bacterium]|nr:ATP synthase F1 subunit delta [Dehalococcoidia bacterium]
MPRLISARRYAQAIFILAVESDELEKWLNDLTLLAESASNSQFLEFMTQPRVPASTKLKVIHESLGNSVGGLALNLVSLLSIRNLLHALPEIADQYQRLLDDHRGIERAEVISAVPLTDQQHRSAVELLEKMSGKEVRLSARVEPRLIGGMILRVGDSVVDGSTKTRLQTMRREMVEGR